MNEKFVNSSDQQDSNGSIPNAGQPDSYVLIANGDLSQSKEIAAQITAAMDIDVRCVSDGLSALAAIEESRPQVLIADVDLQRLDGFQLCRLIKLPVMNESDKIPVILTTAEYIDVISEQAARNVSAFAFIITTDREALIRTVRLALGDAAPRILEPYLTDCRGRALLACDNEEVRAIIENSLKMHGWALNFCKNIPACWPLLDSGQIQCMLLDSSLLAGNDGVSIARICNDYRKLSIVIIADPGDTSRFIRWMEAGADNVILRPLSPKSVMEACTNSQTKYELRSVHEQLQEKIDKLRSVSDYLDMVIDYSQEAIFSCDMEGRVKIWNKGAEKIYGYTSEEIVGRNVDDFLNPSDFKRRATDVVRILAQRGSFAEAEVTRRNAKGDTFPVAATYSSLLNSHGEFIGFSVVERDVTPVKALEAERIKSARLRAITQTAVTANDHINTPLGVILGYSQFLKMKLTNINESDVNALDTIQDQVHKIKGIMNKLKLMSDPIVKNYSIDGVTMFDLSKSK
jgi:PAS domain S-box-containing protein